MKHVFLGVIALLSVHLLPAQEKAWVFLSDKGPDAACQLTAPTNVISEAAWARRQAKGIGLSESDLPVYQAYLSQLSQQAEIIASSKWLNAVVVDPAHCDMEALLALPFVTGTRPVETLVGAAAQAAPATPLAPLENLSPNRAWAKDYGRAAFQNEMVNIPAYHDQGFTGKGVRVAVFDGGFIGADTIAVFDTLRARGQILFTYDLVENQQAVYHTHPHGTQVLSTIAANIPGKMVGSAPDANFILCRTEDTRSETEKEEYNWLRAVEWVDSIGVDIIHSSLGYTTFDDPTTSHKYEDLDGNSTVITRAADLAAKKGILVCTSAGNEGGGSWRYIAAPCDADSALCVGAVDRYLKRSFFSSV
ncbi:MAG: S8 family serine peptidase, partial [Bacteroidota bacterium]